jgi:hypothetical protein
VEAARQDSTRSKRCLALPGVTPLEWAPVGMAPFPPSLPPYSAKPIPYSVLISLSQFVGCPVFLSSICCARLRLCSSCRALPFLSSQFIHSITSM